VSLVEAVKVLDLGQSRKARVWIGELPELSYPQIGLLRQSIGISNAPVRTARRAAIELFKSTCGPSSYGLLGAEFVPALSDRLVIEVVASRSDGPTFLDSMAFQSDDVRIGLPGEYAEAVLESVVNAAESWLLGPGDLRFHRAAHGLAGSSPMIFKQLTAAVVHVIAAVQDQVAEQELGAYLGLSG
jgi:hypothetical protein